MKRRLCLIFKNPAHYRESIHHLIDSEYDCYWHFSDEKTSIKCYDTSTLIHGAKFLHVIKLFGPLYYAKGEVSLLFSKEYDTYLMKNSSFNLSVWLFVILKMFFFRKKKLYLWSHCWYGKERFFEKTIKKIMYKAADGIFPYGNYARDLMVKEGVPSSKIHPIHNSLDYPKQLLLREEGLSSNIFVEHFGNNYSTLIFIGRLTRIKKLDMLVDGLSILKNQGHSYNLVFVGDGEERSNLESLATKKSVKENIWFYGACYDEKKNAELLYNADLCVAPGNIGLTVMHCMAFGTPALTHNTFPLQMPEFEVITPGKTGDFFEMDNVDSMTEKIHDWIISHKENREEIRRACYKVIEESWNPHYQINVLKDYLLF